jgi:hypothetical protein
VVDDERRGNREFKGLTPEERAKHRFTGKTAIFGADAFAAERPKEYIRMNSRAIAIETEQSTGDQMMTNRMQRRRTL